MQSEPMKQEVIEALARDMAKGVKTEADQDEKTAAQPHVAMTWAQRLKRVLNIDVATCRACGAAAKVCLH